MSQPPEGYDASIPTTLLKVGFAGNEITEERERQQRGIITTDMTLIEISDIYEHDTTICFPVRR